MSVTGKYKVQVKTPKGVQDGKITLIANGNSLIGLLENAEDVFEVTDGKVNGNAFEFVTKIKTPMGYHKATVTGIVEGNALEGVAKLFVGSAQIRGIREE